MGNALNLSQNIQRTSNVLKNDHSNYKSINNKKSSSDHPQQSGSIKLPPKKMAKAKLGDQSEERLSGSKPVSNYESEDKLLLLATTSCQKSPIEKSSPFKYLDQSKSGKIAASSGPGNSGEKKRSLSFSKDSDDKNSSLSKAPAKLNTSATTPSGVVNAQLNSNKSRNKQMQSVRGRLEQQLKVLKKKADSKSFNMSSYRKFVTNQPVKTGSTSTKSSTSTGATSTVAPSTSSAQTATSTATTNTTNVVKDTVVANCLKNDCILYPNSKDKDNKDALLNKFKNLSSTSFDSSFTREDSSDSVLGKLEIDTNLESTSDKKDLKSPKTPTKSSQPKSSDSALNSPSNKNLYECDSNSAKLLPMSYSIEKLASSTSIINQPLEPMPPSVFGVFDASLGSDPTKNQFVKKQIDLFPNLNRYSSGFSNWSNAFKANQEKQSSPSFNYTPASTSVFGAFARSNSQTTGNLLSSPTFGGLSSPFKETSGQSNKDKKAASAKRDLDKDYYTSTEDEAEPTVKERGKKKKKGKQAAPKQQPKIVLTDEDTDIDDQLNEDVQRVIKEQLMSEDDDDEVEVQPQVAAKKSTKKSKNTEKETTQSAKKGKKSADTKSPGKAAQPAKRVRNNKAGKSSKKSKATLEKDDEDEQLTEEDEQVEEEQPIKTKAAAKGKGKAAKGKQQQQQKASPASSKNRTSLNASSSTASSVSTAKKGKQVKKTSPASAIKSRQPKNSKSKSKTSISASSETKRERKSEVDRLLDQSSDSLNDFMFTEYETIADKVKRNLGRKSKQMAAAAVSAMSVPDRVSAPSSKQQIDKDPVTSTPAKPDKPKGSAKKSAAATASSAAGKNQSKNKKPTPPPTKKQQANASKNDETDLETEEEANDDKDSSLEEPASKKSTNRNSSSSTASKKRKSKAAETSSPAGKRKAGRGKSNKAATVEHKN